MIAGVVCEQWVRCGKPNCHCRSGRKHGPYFYRFWRQDGKLKKEYIRRAEVDRVRAECQARQGSRRTLNEAWEQWRQLLDSIKEVEKQ